MRVLLWAIGTILAILLLLAVGAMLLVQTEWFKEQVARQLSDEFGRTVTLAGPHAMDWSLQPRFRVRDVRVANADWADAPTMARADAVAVRLDIPSLLRGEVRLPEIEVTSPRVDLERRADGRTNWEFLMDDEEEPPAEPATFEGPEVEQLTVADGLIVYRDAEHQVATQLRADLRMDQELVQAELMGDGEVADLPVTLQLSASTPEVGSPLEVEGSLAVDAHHAEVSGVIRDPHELMGLDLRLALEGPDPNELAAEWGQELPEFGDYHVTMRLTREDATWRLVEIDGQMGDSRLEGTARLAIDERPDIAVDLAIDSLDLDARGGIPEETDTNDEPPEPPTPEALRDALEPLRQVDGELRLLIGEIRAFETVGEDLELDATLEQGVLAVDPLSARVAGGELTITTTVDAAGERVEGSLTGTATPLQLGELVPGAGAGSVHGTVRLELAPEHVLADTTEVHVEDEERALDFRLEADTEWQNGEPRTEVRVVGDRHGQEFVGDLVAGPLLGLTAPGDEAPSLFARLHTGNAVLIARGELDRLLAGTVAAGFSVEGPDVEAFGILLGADLPSIPPYEIHGNVTGGRGSWQIEGVSGQFGDSDLAGDIELLLEPGEPPIVNADLRSDYLKVDDLTVDEADEREAGLAELLQTLDGEFAFRGSRVDTGLIPIEAVHVEAGLDGTRFELRPLAFQLGGGELSFSGFLDGEQVPMRGYLDGEAIKIDLGEVLPALGIDDESAGIVSGRVDVEVEGHTLTHWIATAAGEIRLLLTGGQVDTLLAELAGEDAAEEMMEFLLPEDAAVLDLECAHVAVNPDRGQLGVENFFVTTPIINVIGEGDIDIRERTFDLEINSESDDPDIADLLTPVMLTGPWEEPEVSVLTADLIARAVAALSLGAILAPGAAAAPGAVAPLLAGLGEERTPCHEVIEHAMEEIEEDD